jgi:hypothetical protein
VAGWLVSSPYGRTFEQSWECATCQIRATAAGNTDARAKGAEHLTLTGHQVTIVHTGSELLVPVATAAAR